MADTISTAIYRAGLDPGDYESGAARVVSADQRMMTAGEGVVVTEEKVTKATRLTADSIDRKIARLDPLFAAEQRYAKALEANTRFQQEGIGTAEQRTRLLDLEVQRYNSAVVASNGLSAAIGRNTQMSKQLSFQLFDIAQGIPLAFQSPLYGLQNLAIQTGQISQLYMGQGGLRQAFKDTTEVAKGLGSQAIATGATLVGALLTPTGLVTAGFIAAGAAATAMVAIIISRIPNADEAIKDHRDAIEKIRAAWRDASQGSEEYKTRTLASMQFIANQDRAEQQRLLDYQVRGAVNQLSGISSQFGITSTQRALKEFQPEIDKFLESVRRGAPDVESLSAAIDMRANIDPTNRSLQNAAKALHDVIDGAQDATTRLKSLRGEFVNLRIDQAFGAAAQGPTDAELAARALDEARRRHQAAMGAIGARSPSEQAAAARGFESALPFQEGESPQGRQFREDAAAAEAYAQALYSLQQAERQRADGRNDAIAAAQLENDLIGKGIGEQERLHQQLQMLQQAKEAARQAGTIVSPEEIAQINAAADALGKLVQQRALLQLRSDLSFDRSQLFRSSTEQDVASQMREIYGDDFISHMQDFEAQQIRINDRLRELNDIGSDLTSGAFHDFFDGLKEGQGAFSALGDAGVNALDKIQSKLIDMLADQAWNALFGQLAGLLGGSLGGGSVLAGGSPLGQGGIGSALRSSPAPASNVVPFRLPQQRMTGGNIQHNVRLENVPAGYQGEVTSARPNQNGGLDMNVMLKAIDDRVEGKYGARPRLRGETLR